MAWTAGSGSIAAGTRQTWDFNWGGNGDVGVQHIVAHPLNPNGRLITENIQENLDSNNHYTYSATVFNQGPLTVNFVWRGGGVT
jgi:hypothetical protein